LPPNSSVNFQAVASEAISGAIIDLGDFEAYFKGDYGVGLF
jgi:hypothetical protein